MYELKAQVRQEKNPRELRRQGLIPGVVYGSGFHQLICFPRKDLENLLAKITRSSRITLKLNRRQFDTFIKEIQYDLLTDRVIHVDLYRPPQERPIKMEVPIRLRGEAKGRKSGGIVDQVRELVQVRGLSRQIPELVELDISELDIGQALHAGDVKLPEGVQMITPADAVLVTILAPRKIEEELPSVAEEVAVAAEGEEAPKAVAGEGKAPEAKAPEAAEEAKSPKKGGKEWE